jgi:FtsZ-binding cell division protein ZapB
VTQDLVEENRELKHDAKLKEFYSKESTRLAKQNREIMEQLYRAINSVEKMQLEYAEMATEKTAAEISLNQYKDTVALLQHEVEELREDRGTHFGFSLSVRLSHDIRYLRVIDYRRVTCQSSQADYGIWEQLYPKSITYLSL